MINYNRGDSNTSVVDMHDQRFPKPTLIEICPFEENTHKQELCLFFGPNFNSRQDILRTMFIGKCF